MRAVILRDARRGLVCAMIVLATQLGGTARALPTEFAEDIVASGLVAPDDLTFLPDGRMLVAEHGGVVKLVSAGGTTSTFLDIRPRLNSFGERGLLGIAVDPNFSQFPYLYAYYLFEDDPANPGATKTSRLSRFTVSGNQASLASEVVLLGSATGAACGTVTSDCIPSDFRDHHGGTIKFGADGTIFLSTGDGTTVHGFVATALRSQNLDSLAGKLLRVDRNGKGVASNPFWTGSASANRSKVYAYGFRNPFRFSLRGSNGRPYVADVGFNTWEEIDVVGAGANYGWPCYEGTGRQPGFEPLAECQALYARGASAVRTPMFQYHHNGGGASITGGVVYEGTAFPEQYRGAYFYGDYALNWIRYVKVDANDGLTSQPVTFSTDADGPVDFELGPDGALYYVAIAAGEVRRIRYSPSNRPPSVRAAAVPTTGPAPLDTVFSSSGTSDPDGDPLIYSWNFGDGTATSSSASPAHRYTRNGSFTAVLTVSDGRGASASASVAITVGNNPPVASIDAPSSTFTFAVGDTIAVRGSATDPESGPLPASSLTWNVSLQHCPGGSCHAHPFRTSVVGDRLEWVHEDHGDDIFYDVRLTATDPGGLTHTTSRLIRPRTALVTLKSEPAGLEVVYDGTTYVTPVTRTSVVGATRVVRAPTTQLENEFKSWSDGKANPHALIIAADQTLTATFTAPATSAPAAPVEEARSVGGSASGGEPTDIELTGAASVAAARAGDAFMYRFSVRIKNPATASGVSNLVLSQRLPDGVRLLSARSDRGPGCSGTSTVVCSLDFLSGTLVANVEVLVQVSQPGELVSPTTVSSDTADPDGTNNTVSIVVREPAAPLPTPTQKPPAAKPPPASGGAAVLGVRVNVRSGTSRGDVLNGTAGPDRLWGLQGNDALFGRGGQDFLFGGSGNDRVVGGPARDRIQGGPGRDTIEVRDGARDIVDCGADRDTVFADRLDLVAANCEVVRRR